MGIGIRKLRKLSGVTQYELARLSGIERTRLSLAENGHVRLDASENDSVRRALITAIERRMAQLGDFLPSERDR
jgi:transcriptional regulator with XRE-family HTH domain